MEGIASSLGDWLKQLRFLDRLPRLAWLILDDNGLTRFDPPGSLPNLKTLSFTVNRIADLAFLRFTPNLETLDLAANFATTFDFPEGIPNLSWLNLGENRLTKVTFGQDMTNLVSLWLDDNKFTRVPDIGQLARLRVLDLGINQLTEVTIPHTVTNLILFADAVESAPDPRLVRRPGHQSACGNRPNAPRRRRGGSRLPERGERGA